MPRTQYSNLGLIKDSMPGDQAWWREESIHKTHLFFSLSFIWPLCPAGGILVCQSGIESVPLQWKLRGLTTRLPGKSQDSLLNNSVLWLWPIQMVVAVNSTVRNVNYYLYVTTEVCEQTTKEAERTPYWQVLTVGAWIQNSLQGSQHSIQI